MVLVSQAPFEIKPQYRVGDLLIDVGRQRVTREGVEIALPKLSFELLLALTRAAPNVLSNEELMDRVWPGLIVSPETVSQRIKLVRDLLGDDPRQPRYIAGVRGRGHRLLLPVETVAPPNVAELLRVAEKPVERAKFLAITGPKRPRHLYAGVLFAAILAILVAAGWFARKRLSLQTTATTPVSVTVVAVPSRSVAVLPFENLSQDAGNDYLALGVAEMVLDRLARIHELLVIARTSSFAFRGQNIDARQIGHRLAVRYLVEGSVQRAGSQLRVTARLIDAQSGRQLQALSFDRELRDIFLIQDEIAERVAAALEVRLVRTALARPDRQPINLDAYLEYLHGKALLGRWRVKGAAEASIRFSRAIELDPTFAAAYAELAMAQWQSNFLSLAGSSQISTADERKIRALIERALSLDAGLGEAYVMRALINTTRDPSGAEADFLKGLSLAPNYGPGYSIFSELLHDNLNRGDEALEMIERARLIDPLSARNHYVKALYLQSQDPQAAEALMLQALAVDPNFAPAYARLAHWKWWSGKTAEAVKLVEGAVRLDPDTSWIQHWACAMYLDLGEPIAAQQVAGGSKSLNGQDRILLALYAGDLRAAGELAYAAPAPLDDELMGFEWTMAIRAHAVQMGQLDRAIRFLRATYPHNRDSEPSVNHGDITLAYLLIRRGDRAAASKILAKLRRLIDDNEKTGEPDYWLRGLLAALSDKREVALDALSKLVQRGHMPYWWAVLERDPLWASIRPDPRFQAVLAIERNYATNQRALLDAMRRKGAVPTRYGAPVAPVASH